MSLKLCSLFSGIGGFEVGLRRAGFDAELICENDEAAQSVLREHFPNSELATDITRLKALPKCDLVTAGWPCQDLSQAGRTAGPHGRRSRLVADVFRLLDQTNRKPPHILLENVPFALRLQQGTAIANVVRALEERGYRWAFRVVDTREFGLPQRRRRLFIFASREMLPEKVLFDGINQEAASLPESPRHFGFYWTEGNRGLGWSPEAVPPLKGGSSLSIPSPPAIWDSDKHTFFSPGIKDAERLQGFASNWTDPASKTASGPRARWRLVGNAVSVPVIEWFAHQLLTEGDALAEPNARMSVVRAPNAALGGPKRATRYFSNCSEGPSSRRLVELKNFLLVDSKPLSSRAAKGFVERLKASGLRKNPQFIADLEMHVSKATFTAIDSGREFCVSQAFR